MTKKRGDHQYGYDLERAAARSLFDLPISAQVMTEPLRR
jgi:hypothetical protein